jgi:uncharacterized protein
LTRNPLRVGITEIRKRPGSQKDVDLAAPVEGLALTSSRVPDGADVQVTGVLESLSDGLTATGTVRAPFEGECRRCLGDVRGEIAAPFKEVIEPRPVEGETYLLEGDEVDLTEMVRDAVLLALPLAPLCSEDCPGPAPEAVPVGVDEGDAEEPPRDARWAALDALKFDS